MRPHRSGAAKKASTWATAKRRTCVALLPRLDARPRTTHVDTPRMWCVGTASARCRYLRETCAR